MEGWGEFFIILTSESVPKLIEADHMCPTYEADSRLLLSTADQ